MVGNKLIRKVIILLAGFWALLPSSFALAQSLPQDDANSIYSDTVWYKTESGGTGACSPSLTGSDNEQKTWNYFKGKGLTDKQVAGILGNIEVESSFNPTIMQKGGNSQNPADADPLGWGLIQWTPGSKVINMAKRAGITEPIYMLGSQLDLVWQHMHNNPVVTQPFSMSDFTAIHDEKQAAIYFRDHIEGGADANGIRETDATNILAKYGGTGPSGDASGCGTTAGGAGNGSCKVAYAAEYSQQQLAQIFGDPGTAASHPGLNLQSVTFMGYSVQVSPLIAPCLEAVSSQIQAAKINYKVRAVGCYRFDSNNGVSNIGLLSYHTYGAACDINPDTNPFQLCPACNGPYDMPQQYVTIFKNNGFTWGGDWTTRKDYMHFEWHGVIPK